MSEGLKEIEPIMVRFSGQKLQTTTYNQIYSAVVEAYEKGMSDGLRKVLGEPKSLGAVTFNDDGSIKERTGIMKDAKITRY